MDGDKEQRVNEVLQVEKDWVKALLEKDSVAMEHILADDYTQIAEGGQVLGKVQALAAFSAPHRNWELAESTDHKIRIYGDTALMIATWRSKGENLGVAFNYQARFLAVYVKRQGAWKMVADMATPVEHFS
jgi:ketosteroid isomerase-like protein